MANDYVFFDPRKKAQQQEEDKKKLTEIEEERLRNQEMGEKAVKIIADFTVKPLVLMLVWNMTCLLYTSPSPRDGLLSRMPSSA